MTKGTNSEGMCYQNNKDHSINQVIKKLDTFHSSIFIPSSREDKADRGNQMQNLQIYITDTRQCDTNKINKGNNLVRE